eukprot:343410-Pyramimonas_sp.AAC.1
MSVVRSTTSNGGCLFEHRIPCTVRLNSVGGAGFEGSNLGRPFQPCQTSCHHPAAAASASEEEPEGGELHAQRRKRINRKDRPTSNGSRTKLLIGDNGGHTLSREAIKQRCTTEGAYVA